MKKAKLSRILCVASILTSILSAAAHASTTINFDSHSPDLDGGNPIFEKGIRFDFNAAGWGIFSPSSGACCNVNYNGTPSLFADGSYGNLAGGSNANVYLSGNTNQYSYDPYGSIVDTFTIKQIYGFDASTYWTGATGKIDVIGHFNDGTAVTTRFDIDSTWKHFTLPDTYKYLVGVEFRDHESGAFLSAPGFGLDNIVLTIPEPQTYAMLLAGLGLLGFVAKSKQ